MELQLLIVSLLAGFLTVLAPCMLALLPIIVGGSITGNQRDLGKIIRITVSLALSIVVFTLLLKATTALLGVPQEVWRGISGGIVLLLGIVQLAPKIWGRISNRFDLQANKALFAGTRRHTIAGDIATGAALGPVFTSCSPVYGLLIAVVLPSSFALGLAYIIFYALGLSIALFLVAFVGQSIVVRLKWAADPNGWFRRTLALIFILIGVAIIFGWDKLGEAWLLERGLYDGKTGLEGLLQ